MKEITCNVKILCSDKSATSFEKYIVARYVDTAWYYWGSWNNKDKAIAVAKEIDGCVFELSGVE